MRWIARLFRRPDDDLAEEMRLHIQLRAEQNEAKGLPAQQAHDAAKKRFGNLGQIQESSRAAWPIAALDQLFQDIRYGLRSLAANPSFTAAAVLTLALGIGANTAIFSLVDAVLLRTLPIDDPQALVQITLGAANDGELNLPIWQQIRDRQTAFSGTLAFAPDRFNLASSGEIQLAQGMWVSGDFFTTLGVPMHIGRPFTRADEVWGAGQLTVISHAFWQTHFHGDPQVLGKQLPLDGHTFTVIGVTPPWFRGLDVDAGFQVAIPLGAIPILNPDRKLEDEKFHWWLSLIGRLPAGIEMAQAEARLRAFKPDVSHPESLNPSEIPPPSFQLHPAALGFSNTRTRYGTVLPVLMVTVLLILAIACVNVANLLLARATARQRELAIRLAIGASRWRIVRQLLTESLLLAAAGAAAGLLLALWATKGIIQLLSTSGNPLDIPITPDAHILGFTIGITVLTALLFGLAPALNATSQLRGPVRFPIRKALVSIQVALSLVLIVGAGLFLGTLRNLLSIDPGFDPAGVITIEADLRQTKIPAGRRSLVYSNMLEQLRTLPGIGAAATSTFVSIGSRGGWAQPVIAEGTAPKSKRDSMLFFNRLSPGYLATMRIPLISGRDFNERDTLAAPGAILWNESAARKFFPNANPLGRNLSLDKKKPPYRVIGIVKNSTYNLIDEAPRPVGYLASTQDADPFLSIVFSVRATQPIDAILPSLRTALSQIEPNLTLQIQTLESRIGDSLIQPRIVAQLSLFFGGLAMLLAIVGLYGITSYSVTRRKSELGIRAALGAGQFSILWLVLGDTFGMLAAGLAIGLLASLVAARFLSSLLFGVTPDDPAVFIAAALLLATASVCAAAIPARRAARLDPMKALREN